jgi:hypothetical protein
MSLMGQNPNLPHRNTDARFTSISRPQQGGFTATLSANWRPEQVQQNPYSITSSASTSTQRQLEEWASEGFAERNVMERPIETGSHWPLMFAS